MISFFDICLPLSVFIHPQSLVPSAEKLVSLKGSPEGICSTKLPSTLTALCPHQSHHKVPSPPVMKNTVTISLTYPQDKLKLNKNLKEDLPVA